MAGFLFVEDDDDTRDGAARLLTDELPEGEVVFAAANYEEAIKSLTENRAFDNILSDLNYPGPNGQGDTGGLDLLKYVQENMPQIPFFLYTGKSPSYVEATLKTYGVDLPSENIFYKPVHYNAIGKIMGERFCQAARPGATEPQDKKPKNALGE